MWHMLRSIPTALYCSWSDLNHPPTYALHSVKVFAASFLLLLLACLNTNQFPKTFFFFLKKCQTLISIISTFYITQIDRLHCSFTLKKDHFIIRLSIYACNMLISLPLLISNELLFSRVMVMKNRLAESLLATQISKTPPVAPPVNLSMCPSHKRPHLVSCCGEQNVEKWTEANSVQPTVLLYIFFKYWFNLIFDIRSRFYFILDFIVFFFLQHRDVCQFYTSLVSDHWFYHLNFLQ